MLLLLMDANTNKWLILYFHFKACQNKLPWEVLEETHELFSFPMCQLHEERVCASSVFIGMLACDANGLCFRPGRNV